MDVVLTTGSYCDGYGYCYGTSPWASYGRWIRTSMAKSIKSCPSNLVIPVLAAIIVGAFLIFLLFA